jgi:hypothetical protein
MIVNSKITYVLGTLIHSGYCTRVLVLVVAGFSKNEVNLCYATIIFRLSVWRNGQDRCKNIDIYGQGCN